MPCFIWNTVFFLQWGRNPNGRLAKWRAMTWLGAVWTIFYLWAPMGKLAAHTPDLWQLTVAKGSLGARGEGSLHTWTSGASTPTGQQLRNVH